MVKRERHSRRYDYQAFLHKIWQFKWVYLLFIVILSGVAFFRNTFTAPVYKNSMQVFINLDALPFVQNHSEHINAMSFLQNNSNIENEISKMRSFGLIRKALSELGYEITYYEESYPFEESGRFLNLSTIKRVINTESPIKVQFYKGHQQLVDVPFYIEFLSDSTYQLSIKGSDVIAYNYIDNMEKQEISDVFFRQKFQIGEEVKTPYFHFFIDLDGNSNKLKMNRRKFFFTFEQFDNLALAYLENLEIEQTTPNSSLLSISLKGANYEKVTDFLNQLVLVYFKKDLEQKNRKAVKTIQFIDSQISDVANSLSSTGNVLEKFRSENQVIDVDYQGQQMYETLNNLEQEKAMAEMQSKYYTQLLTYIQENKLNQLIAPASANLQDPVLSTLLVRLTDLHSNKLVNEKRNEKSFYLQNLNQEISSIQETVLEHIKMSLKSLDITLNDIDYRIEKITEKLAGLPATELKLQSIQRQFELNDEIYNYLLTKRAEAQIGQASSFPSYEIIDPARYINAEQIKPRKVLNYALALFLGLMLPTVYLLGIDVLTNRVRSIRELEYITNLPILGHIAHSRLKEQDLSLTNNAYSGTAESIRTLRTNVQLLSAETDSKLIVLTSSTSSEGKTFSSIGLAKSFSLLNKRVVLVGYDLRKPRLAKQLGIDSQYGLSLFLSGKCKIDKIIHKTSNQYLDVIPEGPLPPNPTELVASAASKELVSILRQMYDYIIFDTSPVGVVPDGKLLLQEADICLLIIRQYKSRRHEVINTLKSFRQTVHQHLYLVLNDFMPKNDRLHYMYKYYSDRPNNKFAKWLPWIH
ncbi:MAG: GumC family protein [Bacteroidota bacterium]